MKKCILCAVAMLMSGLLLAAPVKKDAAKMKAAAVLQQQAASVKGKKAPKRLLLESLEPEGSAYYVFNDSNGAGFAIVAGDDRFGDIIGYSEEGTLNEAQMPEALRLTLEDYAAAVKFAQENNIEVKKGPRKAERANINHFVNFAWNQSGKYSQNCPTDCSTGCMAVTTAMIMAYYKYPETLPAVYNSNVTEQASAEAWSPNYNAFLSSYSSYSSVGEMPRFMRHVADALNTSYSTSGSGALAGALIPAFKTFGYDPGMRTIMRDSYSQEDWDEIIYEELAAGRPVSFYGEHNQLGGHSYIADGYQASTGFFYINWGWGGTCNGWFDMGILNPFVTYFGSWAGMGYTCPPAGFTGGLNAVIGIQPKKEGTVTEEVLVLNCEDMRRNGSSVQAEIFNRTGSGYRGSIRWAVLNADETFTLVDGNSTSINYSESYKYANLNPSTLTLEDGTYRLVPVCKKDDETEWHLCTGYKQRYVDITIAGGEKTIDVHPVVNVTVDNVCYFGKTDDDSYGSGDEDQYLEYVLTINNQGDDVYGNILISGVRSDGARVGGSSMYLGLSAGKKKTMSLFLEKGSGYNSLTNPTYEVTISYRNQVIWKGTVTDSRNYANYTTYTGVDFEDYEYVEGNAYLYSTVLKGDVKIKNENSYGSSYYIFNGPIRITLKDENKEVVGETVQQYVLQKNAEQAYPVNFEGLKSGKKYYLTVEALNSTRSGSNYSQTVDKAYFTDFEITVKVGIPYYNENGTLERVMPEDAEPTDLPANTAAVDFSKFDASMVDLASITNPNCLYIFPAGAEVPAEFEGKNVVVGGVAEKLTLTDGSPVVFPVEFTAEEAVYTRTFSNFNNGTDQGWNTIVLPFEAKVRIEGESKDLDWFHSKSDSGRKFWLHKYTNGVGGTVYFDFETAATMQANTPYLLAVPGDKWGEKYDLHNKPFTFYGENVTVSATTTPATASGEYVFSGTYTKADCADGYKLNEAGDFFELQAEGATEKPFRAFFASTEETSSSASAKVLRLDFSETNGINMMESKEVSLENATIYNLNGQRIKQLQRGVNIVNGKKIIVK